MNQNLINANIPEQTNQNIFNQSNNSNHINNIIPQTINSYFNNYNPRSSHVVDQNHTSHIINPVFNLTPENTLIGTNIIQNVSNINNHYHQNNHHFFNNNNTTTQNLTQFSVHNNQNNNSQFTDTTQQTLNFNQFIPLTPDNTLLRTNATNNIHQISNQFEAINNIEPIIPINIQPQLANTPPRVYTCKFFLFFY